MAEKVLTERFTLDSTAKVDVEKGIITGARLCGEHSKNGRRYDRKAFSEGRGKYEGAKSYFDHSKNGGERSVRDLAAKVENVTIDNQGMPRGTLRFYDSADPLSRKILNIAATSPGDIGLSHVARCKTRFEGGVEVIESIECVESVDIVTDPATTKGFFESKNMDKITLKALSEKIGPKLGPKKWARFETMLEMEDGAGDLEMTAPADDATADASLTDALKVLVASLVDAATTGDLSPEDAGAKLTAFLNTHLDKAPAEEPEGDGEETPSESTKKPKRKTAVKKESTLTAADVAKIVATEIAKHKTESAAEAEKPKSGPKAEPKKESAGQSADVPDDAKQLAEWLKK